MSHHIESGDIDFETDNHHLDYDTSISESYEIIDLPATPGFTRTDPIKNKHSFDTTMDELDDNNNIQSTISTISMTESMKERLRVTVDDFDKIVCIGKGGFAKVFQVRKNNGIDVGTYYAMKVVKKLTALKTPNDIIHQKTERQVLESARHPFLIEMKYAFQTVDRLYMVLEFAQGGELYNLLERHHTLSEKWAAFYLSEITVGLGFLHGLGVIYRDLKPENVLIDAKGHVKLADFGLAKYIKRENNKFGTTNTFCGTVEYMAPEIVTGNGHSKEVDWWTLGTLMYDMLEGRPPFQSPDSNREETMRSIRVGKLVLNKDLSKEARDIIVGLLQRNYKNRLGFGDSCDGGDVEAVLRHPYFVYYGLDDRDKIEALNVPFIPFTPEIEDFSDAPYVESCFKKLTLAGSPPDTIPDFYDETFSGFSYPNNFIQQEETCELGSSPLVTLTCR